MTAQSVYFQTVKMKNFTKKKKKEDMGGREREKINKTKVFLSFFE